jgi:uncharacterized membrane-anchored protein YjiN (DUF445 family)
MRDFNMVVLIVLSFILGITFNRLLSSLLSKMRSDKLIKDINDQFKQILDNISSNKSKFINRINSTVFIKTNLNDYGDVNIIYLLDKKDVAIFRESKCIYSSESVDKELIKSIVETIDRKYHNKIEDVVEILGFTFSRDDFEKTFKIKVEDFKTKSQPQTTDSDIDAIIEENELKLSMDEILDKISKVGMENLTDEEKEFLKNFNN